MAKDIITIDSHINQAVISRDMVGDDHLHIDEDDQIANTLTSADSVV